MSSSMSSSSSSNSSSSNRNGIAGTQATPDDHGAWRQRLEGGFGAGKEWVGGRVGV